MKIVAMVVNADTSIDTLIIYGKFNVIDMNWSITKSGVATVAAAMRGCMSSESMFNFILSLTK